MFHTHYTFFDTESASGNDRCLFGENESLLYMSSSVYEKDWNSIFHSHSFTEIFYIVGGEGTLLTGNEKFPLRADDLVILNPHVKHTEVSSPDKKLHYIVLGVDNLKFDLGKTENLKIHSTTGKRQNILPLLELMLSELKEKNNFYEEISKHYLFALLLKIRRLTDLDVSAHHSAKIPQECSAAKSYMDAYYKERITLDALARLAHWDKYYFSHMFTKTFGISPINYLLERRILHSKELLKSTDLSITQIAEATGFSSQNYFSQSFRRYTGETPLAYRARHTRPQSVL